MFLYSFIHLRPLKVRKNAVRPMKVQKEWDSEMAGRADRRTPDRCITLTAKRGQSVLTTVANTQTSKKRSHRRGTARRDVLVKILSTAD